MASSSHPVSCRASARIGIAEKPREPHSKRPRETLRASGKPARSASFGYGDPTVYLTDALPAMDDVKTAKTRPVDEFEAKALKGLAGGNEVVAEATTNRIRMVGAIRMASACMKCHEGNRGDLLGAFTYELVRDPAYVKIEKK
jgi:hypothetical protein